MLHKTVNEPNESDIKKFDAISPSKCKFIIPARNMVNNKHCMLHVFLRKLEGNSNPYPRSFIRASLTSFLNFYVQGSKRHFQQFIMDLRRQNRTKSGHWIGWFSSQMSSFPHPPYSWRFWLAYFGSWSPFKNALFLIFCHSHGMVNSFFLFSFFNDLHRTFIKLKLSLNLANFVISFSITISFHSSPRRVHKGHNRI